MAELRSVSCAYLANASSTEFLPFQQIIKYSTNIPSNLPSHPGYTYSPYESFTVPFLQGSANPTDPNFNNHAMFNYSGKYVHTANERNRDRLPRPNLCAHACTAHGKRTQSR